MPTGAKALLLGAAIGILGITVSLLPSVFAVETNLGLKLLFWLRGARPAPPEVAIVTIDRETADHFRLPNESALWPRALHARLVRELSARGVRVIVFDIAFHRPQNPEHDRMLAEALHEAGNVVLFQRLHRDIRHLNDLRERLGLEIHVERQHPLLPQFARAARGTAPFPLPKVPVRVDQCWLFKGSAGDMPTLPVVALQAYALAFHQDLLRLLQDAAAGHDAPPPRLIAELGASRDATQVARRLRYLLHTHDAFTQRLFERLEDRQRLASPTAQRVLSSLFALYVGENGHYLDFYGPPQTILTVPYHHLLDPALAAKHDPPRVSLAGKVVFVGFAEQLQPEQRDGFYTVFSRPDGVDVSGVEIAATAFANILEGRSVRPLTGFEQVILLGVFGIVTGAVLLPLRPAVIPFVATGIALAYLATGYRVFSLDGTWLPIALPALLQVPLALLGAVLWHYFDARHQQRQTHATFGYYVPKSVVGTLIRDRATPASCRQSVYGACLATDAEQYTRLSESLTPDQLRRFLNLYYQRLFTIVNRHGGFISDVVGDAMLAIWAGKMPEKKRRQGACLAAIDIRQELHHCRSRVGEGVLPTRFGLHAGQMVLGNVGAEDHFEYRAVGDVVNTAHRLEQFNKILGTRILASAEVIRGIDGVVVRELGYFRLTGKRHALLVYEVMGYSEDDVESPLHQLHVRFAEALEALRRQRFTEAQHAFQRLLDRHPDDGPSRFYVSLCERLQRTPLELGWDGVVKLAETSRAENTAQPTEP